jgi:hypothetical protein
VVLTVAFWRNPPPERSRETPREPTPPPALPLEVLRWQAKYIEYVGARPRTQGILGETVFRPRLGDRIDWIEGELSEPAHAYLLAYLPNGEEELCWPRKKDQTPPRAEEARYPPRGEDVQFSLDDGLGLQVFVLVASRQSLPAYESWLKQRGPAPWKKGEKLADEVSDVVWRDKGLGLDGWDVQHPFRAGGTPINRGKDAEKMGVGPLVRLKRWWREQPEIEVVAVLAMTVGPR